MKIMTRYLAILGLSVGLANAKPMARERNELQHDRIQEGVQSGDLTHHEANKLHREEGRVHRAERRARSDGTVSNAEKKHVNRMQNKVSSDIYGQKHDDQTRR